MNQLLNRILAVVIGAAAIAMPTQQAWAQQNAIPNTQSRLYYRIGGGDPASRSANPGAISQKLSLGGIGRLNYSCGKFDAGVSFQALMSGFSKLGTTIVGAVKAGIASLPMYIFQRAQPGLYELYQTYAKKAEVMIAASLKTCEEMEAQIKAGQDPYEGWIKEAKTESWKSESDSGQDVVVAKDNVEQANGREGVTWLGGQKFGGLTQKPISVIKDLVTAGFNTTMSQPVTASDTVTYSSTGGTGTKLARTFPRAMDASAYATDVLGDMVIATCSEPSCPAKGTVTGLGLLPKYEAEQVPAAQQIKTLLAAAVPNYQSLDDASAPGVAITRELVDAMREMPDSEQRIVSGRLSREIAVARTIDKALTVRTLLLTGMSHPEAGRENAQVEAKKKVDLLNRYIDDLLFESRVRREIVSNTAEAVLDSYRSTKSQSVVNGKQSASDAKPLSDGRVK